MNIQPVNIEQEIEEVLGVAEAVATAPFEVSKRFDCFKILYFNELGSFTVITQAMEIPFIGCVVKTLTVHSGGTSEALTFVPGVKIVSDTDHPGCNKLIAI